MRRRLGSLSYTSCVSVPNLDTRILRGQRRRDGIHATHRLGDSARLRFKGGSALVDNDWRN